MNGNTGGEKHGEDDLEKLYIKNEKNSKMLLDKTVNDHREESKKKVEVDSKKFMYLRRSLAKITNEIEQEVEQTIQEEIQNARRMSNLKEMQLSLEENTQTADEEIEATKAALKAKEEKLELMKEIERANVAKFDAEIAEYGKDYLQLQMELKKEYEDLETLVEMVGQKLSSEHRKLFLMELFRRFKEMKKKRQRDFEEEKSVMEKVLSKMKEKSETLRKQVEAEEEKHQSQCEFYRMALKGKEVEQRK